VTQAAGALSRSGPLSFAYAAAATRRRASLKERARRTIRTGVLIVFPSEGRAGAGQFHSSAFQGIRPPRDWHQGHSPMRRLSR